MFHLYGQERDRSFGNVEQTDTSGNVFDHVKASGIVHKMDSWTLEENYSRTEKYQLDTATINFHNYYPFLKKSFSNSYLGFLGAPYESNLFFERDETDNNLFLRHLAAYHLSSNEVAYYNTTTPYANLKYYEGNQRKMQDFEAFFTRNIDSLTNFGFRFNVINNISQYNTQEANHKNLLFFVSRNTGRYNGYLHFINRNNNLLNNGGISAQNINVQAKSFDLGTNLPTGLSTENKSMAFFTSHEYLMGQLPFLQQAKPDTTIAADSTAIHDFVPAYSVQYTAEFNTYKHFIEESSVNQLFFDTTFMNTSSNTDSSFFNVFKHAFHLKAFENPDRKFTFGKRAYIENELVRAVHPLPYGRRIYTYSNLNAGAEIYNQSATFLKWRALANLTFLGRNIGDATIKGEVIKPIVLKADTMSIEAEAWYRDFSANIFEEHWQSNHFKWDNNFKKQHEVVVRSKFSYPTAKLYAGFDYALLSNFLYNNQLGMPDQYNNEFSVVAAWLNKDFHFWRFIWSNKAVWQAVSNNTVLRLPVASAYSSISYSHYLFKVMKINIGAEVYYNTPFNANFYEPSTTRFYLQDELLTGGYPLINLYANAKLKRTRAFAILEHANSRFKFGEFFSTPRYPLEQMTFRFGLLWTFYD